MAHISDAKTDRILKSGVRVPLIGDEHPGITLLRKWSKQLHFQNMYFTIDPESPQGMRIFFSCSNGELSEEDMNGFVSQLVMLIDQYNDKLVPIK